MRPVLSIDLFIRPDGGAPPPGPPGLAADGAPEGGQSQAPDAPLSFETVYDDNVEFVWRSLRRMGVADAAVDDALQDVFVVVHRRLADFERRAAVRTWLFGIALRVARAHRRHQKRPERAAERALDPEILVAPATDRPDERARTAEGVRLMHQLLDELDEDKRAVFILAELEQMSTYEIADALEVNRNTVASRLRAAKADFEQAVARLRARDRWRQP